MAMKMSDVQALTDDQLYDMLSHFFPVVGPVVDSTRSVYQSMLLNKLLESGDALPGGVAENPVDPEKAENLGTFESAADYLIPTPTPPKPKPHQFKRWNEEENDLFGVQNYPTSHNIRSRATTFDKISPERYSSPPPQPVRKQGSAVKKITLVAIFFVLAGIVVFFVNQKQDPYQNIESEAGSMTGSV